MPKRSSSREIVRIRRSALVFAAMMLTVGVLLLATNNIDPKAMRRPTVPVDVFADIQYVSWKSPDGLIQFEYPDTWIVKPIGSFAYMIVPAATRTGEVFISLSMRTTASLLGWFRLDNMLTQDTTPDVLLQRVLPSLPSSQPLIIKPVQAGSLKGASLHYADDVPQGVAGQAMHNEGEWWLLSLDSTHMLELSPVVIGNNWPKMQPVFDRLVSTLKVDALAAVKAVDAAESPTAQAAPSAVPAVGTPPATP